MTFIHQASIEGAAPRWWIVPVVCALASFFVATNLVLAAVLGVLAASTGVFLARNATLVFDQPDATNRDKKRFLVRCAVSGIVLTPLVVAAIAYFHAQLASVVPFPPLSFFAFAASFSVVTGVACLVAARKFS